MLKSLSLLCITAVLSLTLMSGMAAAQTACDASVDHLAAGQAAFEAGDFAGAVAAYTCAIEADPRNWDAYYRRGEAGIFVDVMTARLDFIQFVSVFTPGAFDAAIERYTQQIAAEPDNVTYYVLRSYMGVLRSQFEMAAADAARVVELAPANYFGYLYSATANQFAGNTANVAADFARAVELAPDNEDVYFAMARAYRLTDELELAAGVIDQGLARLPEAAWLYAERGYLLGDQGDLAGAVEQFSRAVELLPENAELVEERGVLYHDLGQVDLAIADYTRSIELLPLHLAAYDNRQFAYIDAGDFESALADATTLIELNPEDPEHYLDRGYTYELMGDAAAAAPDYLQWVEGYMVEQIDGEPLAAGATVTLAMVDGRAYRLPFEASAGQTFDITAQAVEVDTVDTVLLVLSPDGTPLTVSDDNQSDANFTDSTISGFSAPAAGTYTLILTHGLYGDGQVNVTLSEAAR